LTCASRKLLDAPHYISSGSGGTGLPDVLLRPSDRGSANGQNEPTARGLGDAHFIEEVSAKEPALQGQ
jgi:hypothetical protein